MKGATQAGALGFLKSGVLDSVPMQARGVPMRRCCVRGRLGGSIGGRQRGGGARRRAAHKAAGSGKHSLP